MASHAQKTRTIRNKRPAKPGVVVGVILAFLALCISAVFVVCAMWLQDLPDYEDASAYNYASKTKIYANDGKTLLAELYLENRDPVTMDAISPYVLEGTVATEDERFYEHTGVDVMGIARAVFVNIMGGQEGASTITQQFVRNTVLADEMNEISIKRKVREAYIAIKLEEMYTKEEILQMYLNTINYGQGAYGIEAASRLYFSKNAKDLELHEAATLIGIPQSPTYNNPIDNPENCLERRNLVLSRMLTNGYITQEEHDAAVAESLALDVTRSESADGLYKYKYFTSYVRDLLLEEYSMEEVFKGGLEVITTLDIDTQKKAEKAVDNRMGTYPDNLECALVAVDPDTGFIKAMVGGKDFEKDEFNLATQAKRQPGSSFKTFTLLAALDQGISPRTSLDCSSRVTIGNWKVENYGGSDYGMRTLASAFAVSSNTGFAELVTEIGAESVVDMAKTCGIESELDAVPAITLGTEEVTVLEMAQAYATIANGGTKREAVPIEKIIDSSGKTVFEAETEGEKVLDTALTEAATDVMKGVVSGGTGGNAYISGGQPVGGKTGTSENWRDKWFCGITPQLSVAIWIGGREEVQMPSYIACDGIFGAFMSAVLSGEPIEYFPTSDIPLEYDTLDIGNGTDGETEEEEEEETEEETTETPEEGTTTDPSTGNQPSDGTGGSTGGNTGNTGNAGGSGSAGSGGNTGGSTGGNTSGNTGSGGNAGGGTSGGNGNSS